MIGIFVNDDGRVKFAQEIVAGRKPLETRGKDMLRPCVGKRVAVVQTRQGKPATVIGYVDIVSAEKNSRMWLHANRDLTLIPQFSKYDECRNGYKWCYWLENPEACKPYPLPESAVRHGRSWCEFQMEF